MSNKSDPLSGGEPLFLAPVMPADPPAPAAHHPRPKPAEHMCTCGKVREACVHDEVRALWSAVAGSPAAVAAAGKPAATIGKPAVIGKAAGSGK